MGDQVLDQAGCSSAVDIMLDALYTIIQSQRVNVVGKVLKVSDPMVIAAKSIPLRKQDCVLGDSCGRARVVPGLMREGNSYKLNRVSVCEFVEVK